MCCSALPHHNQKQSAIPMHFIMRFASPPFALTHQFREEIMPDILQLSDFAPYLHQPFEIRTGDSGVHEAVLIEAKDLGHDHIDYADLRRPFSILFRCPHQTPLPQSIYWIAHPGLGEHEVFLVPVAHFENGVQYEAIFA